MWLAFGGAGGSPQLGPLRAVAAFGFWDRCALPALRGWTDLPNWSNSSRASRPYGLPLAPPNKRRQKPHFGGGS